MLARRTGIFRIVRDLALGAVVFATSIESRAQSGDDAAMDKLLAPIALYPDALLAQVLTASTSPEQVKEFEGWLKQQSQTGSDLQKAATDAGFEASFASLALFPEVVTTLATNPDWTKELGTAYLSKPEAVMASVQRLRDKAHDAGNLKTNDQQTVNVEGSGSTQTIVIQPSNPQVVYVPSYDPQVVYAPPPPQQSNDAMLGLIAFAAGIAIGAAIDNDPYYYGPYGWGAWGMGWGGGAVVYRRSAWVVPVRPRYPYARPIPGYRPNVNVVAPRRTNVTVNVNNRNRVNVGNDVNIGNKTSNVNNRNSNNRNVNAGAANTRDAANRNTNASKGTIDRASAANTRSPATSNRATTSSRTPDASRASNNQDRGHATQTASAKSKGGSAMGGYGNGTSTKAASNRGKSSASKSHASAGARKR